MNDTQDVRVGGGFEIASRLPPDALIIVPTRDLVLFPGHIIPVAVGRQRSILGAQEAVRRGLEIGLVLQRDPETELPAAGDLHEIGTAATVVRYLTASDGAHLICQGRQRLRVLEFVPGLPYYAARVERIEEPEIGGPPVEARILQLKERATEVLGFLPQAPGELASTVQEMNSAPRLADFVAGLLDLAPEEKQEVLATLDVEERLDKVLGLLARRLEVLRLSQEIGRQTQGRMDERQREYLLREQLRTIQEELGEADEEDSDLEELAGAIDAAQMPAEVETHARKELRRLTRMNEAAAEHSMLRTYLEWLVELPWGRMAEDRIEIEEARRILDEDHCGLEKVKRRILEHLAVHKLNPLGKSPILCFVGPPGVGKTSLGQSIARATGRPFARVSLGGVHDEAEIRGHRRTYVGALPGNIIEAVRKAGAKNCVLMLDEMDKLGAGIHGDPSAALLEVLDPAQNSTFRDNYLGVPFDLSKVMFIATANVIDAIPGPLRDRMEVIHLPGYTENEKMQIARRFLVERQREAAGLKPEQGILDDDALHAVVRDYTREAGVRNLEREIGKLFRHAAIRVAEGGAQTVHIGVADLAALLGPARFENEVAMRTSLPGVATGLAWTPVGGDILFIEATLMPGKGQLILTGQLGEVMKESAQAALSLVKTRADQFQVSAEALERRDIHVHVPAGAIPKDGPSAGMAMFVALASLLIGRPVRADRAMTGEISLRGLVLPVGGIKEKALAAQRAGIDTVLLPARNRKELEDIPEDVRQQANFVWLETVDDALREALVPMAPVARGAARERRRRHVPGLVPLAGERRSVRAARERPK